MSQGIVGIGRSTGLSEGLAPAGGFDQDVSGTGAKTAVGNSVRRAAGLVKTRMA